MKNVVELVKSLSKGPCSCIYRNGSCRINADPITGKALALDYNPGTLSQCRRCAARAALEADGIEYEKVDHLPVQSFA